MLQIMDEELERVYHILTHSKCYINETRSAKKRVSAVIRDINANYFDINIDSGLDIFVKEYRGHQKRNDEAEMKNNIANILVSSDMSVGVLFERVRDVITEEKLSEISNRHLYRTLQYVLENKI